MDLKEYEKVKTLKYDAYCVYLQNKYGLSPTVYCTRFWKKCHSATRTSDGLYLHHTKEDCAILLCDPKVAPKYPYSYQEPQNLCYCDLLEHLFLHILICEKQIEQGATFVENGISGAILFMIPELNDIFSGFITRQRWRRKCHSKVINDKDVYLALIKRFKTNAKYYFLSPMGINCVNSEEEVLDRANYLICKSFNAKYGLWNETLNAEIYKEIRDLEKGE